MSDSSVEHRDSRREYRREDRRRRNRSMVRQDDASVAGSVYSHVANQRNGDHGYDGHYDDISRCGSATVYDNSESGESEQPSRYRRHYDDDRYDRRSRRVRQPTMDVEVRLMKKVHMTKQRHEQAKFQLEKCHGSYNDDYEYQRDMEYNNSKPWAPRRPHRDDYEYYYQQSPSRSGGNRSQRCDTRTESTTDPYATDTYTTDYAEDPYYHENEFYDEEEDYGNRTRRGTCRSNKSTYTHKSGATHKSRGGRSIESRRNREDSRKAREEGELESREKQGEKPKPSSPEKMEKLENVMLDQAPKPRTSLSDSRPPAEPERSMPQVEVNDGKWITEPLMVPNYTNKNPYIPPKVHSIYEHDSDAGRISYEQGSTGRLTVTTVDATPPPSLKPPQPTQAPRLLSPVKEDRPAKWQVNELVLKDSSVSRDYSQVERDTRGSRELTPRENEVRKAPSPRLDAKSMKEDRHSSSREMSRTKPDPRESKETNRAVPSERHERSSDATIPIGLKIDLRSNVVEDVKEDKGEMSPVAPPLAAGSQRKRLNMTAEEKAQYRLEKRERLLQKPSMSPSETHALLATVSRRNQDAPQPASALDGHQMDYSRIQLQKVLEEEEDKENVAAPRPVSRILNL